MHARYQGSAVHSHSKTGKISAARAQAIVSRTLRDKVSPIDSTAEGLLDGGPGDTSTASGSDTVSTVD
jgi:hypothetical protein